MPRHLRNTGDRPFLGCLAALLVILAAAGCKKAPTPPPAPPSFKLPTVGDATDTVLQVGDSLPKIQSVDLDGNPIALNEHVLPDGYTLIVFWSTWCGFCMLELPHEVELANRYQKDGLRVIGINADDTPAIAQAAAAKHGVPWLNFFEGPDTTISAQLGINQWPVLILLGPDGKVISGTPQLRGIHAERLPDGTTQQATVLDRTLEHLLGRH